MIYLRNNDQSWQSTICCNGSDINRSYSFWPVFINLWAGQNYSDAYHIVLLVMMPITVPLIQNVGISILQAKNMQGFRSVVYVAIAVLNVLASIPLAKMWGGLGCALATGIS